VEEHTSSILITNNLVRLIVERDPNQANVPLEHRSRVLVAKGSPDWKYIVSVTEENVLRLWHRETCQAISQPCKYDTPIRKVKFSPDSNKLLVISDARAEIINLKRFDRPKEELVLLARVISGLAADKEGNLQRITPAKRQEYWRTRQ